MPNYTINTVTTLEEPGDVVSGGTLPASNVLVITPDPGYVLDAAGFSAPAPLPTGVSNVTFANSTTAFAVGNVVNVTVTYASNLTMPAADLNLNINICENGGVNTGPTNPVGSNVNTTIKFLLHRFAIPTHSGGTCTMTPVTTQVNGVTVCDVTVATLTETGYAPSLGFITGTYPQIYTDKFDFITVTADPSIQTPHTVVQGTYRMVDPSEDPNVAILPQAWQSSNNHCVNLDPTGLICDISDNGMLTGVNPLYTGILLGNSPNAPTIPDNFNGYIESVTYNSAGNPVGFDWKITYIPYTQAQLDNITYQYVAGINVFPGTYVAPTQNSAGSGSKADQHHSSVIARHQVFADPGYQYHFTNNYFVKNLVDSAAPTTGSNGGWDVLLNQAGETRTITVDADIGAVFSATFVDASNNSILASPITNVTVGPSGFYSWNQTFPATNSTTTYTLVISAGTNTTLSSMFLSRSPSSTFVYNQVFTTPGSGPLVRVTSNSASSFGFSSITPVTLSSTFVPNYRFGPTNNTVPFTMAITKSGGGNLSLTRQPIWPNDYTNSDPASNGGTVVDLTNLTATGSGTSTITLAGNATRTLIGTAAVDMALQLDNFINVAGSNIPVSGITLQYDVIASGQFNVGSSIQILANVTPSNPTNPLLTWTVSGTGFTVTPSADTHKATVSSATTAGTRTVTCTAQDGSGVSATIDVTALAQNLITVDDEVTAYKGVATTLPIVNNDTTIGGGCTIVIVQAPSHGVTSIQGESITYTSEAGVNLDSVSFTYKLTKSGFADSNTSTVTITFLEQ
tara:strand:- start:4545 stop:6932 length:2388 start_codon:yes stop_codon:yes gene_type:complete